MTSQITFKNQGGGVVASINGRSEYGQSKAVAISALADGYNSETSMHKSLKWYAHKVATGFHYGLDINPVSPKLVDIANAWYRAND